jgi:RNA polymerase sigma-70 factor (ECF subfamily)
MLDDQEFNGFVKRVRAGDEQAASELVRRYEPEIRREVRLRLRDPRLRRDFDSVDICQSVLASFFVRAALGQYELERPEQLLKLLVTMARNKLVHQVRKQRSQRRDNRRLEAAGQEKLASVAGGANPSELVARQELLQVFRNRMSAEERQLVELRSQGRDWAEIAAEVGGTAEARRKQLARALDRIGQQLGLDEVDGE